jgi:hypothetical protein
MDFHITGRQQGKTTAIVKWLVEDSSRVLVVANMAMGDVVLDNARRQGIELHNRIISPHQQRPLDGLPQSEVAVDNLDCMLSSLLKLPPYLPITRVSATGNLINE